jgi:hypothetical protein
MGPKDKLPPKFGPNEDQGHHRPVSDAAAVRLKMIAASLNLPISAFDLTHSRAELQRVFASREEEEAKLLQLYFAVDDVATRNGFLELLRGLTSNNAEVQNK